MDIERAIELIEVIAKGVDPFTGEVIDDGPLQHPDIIRALFLAVKGLEILGSKEETLRSIDKARLKIRFNAGEPWSQADDEELLILFDSGMKTQELAEKYGRTNGAIRARLIRLGRTREDLKPKGNWRPWTENDDTELLKAFELGKTIQECAEELNRTEGSIRARLLKYGRKENHKVKNISPISVNLPSTPWTIDDDNELISLALNV